MTARFLLVVALAAAQDPAEVSQTRFGREVARPAGKGPHRYAKLHGIEVPEQRGENYAVQCLLYQDAERIYIEAGILNRSRQDLAIAADFISVESEGVRIARTDTVKAAEQIEDAAYRAFVPKGSGKAYDRESVDRQAKEHIEKQEREVTFAGLLLALAQESVTGAIKAGGERSIACTFQQRKDRKAPLRVVIRAGGEMFVFEFESREPESGKPARAS